MADDKKKKKQDGPVGPDEAEFVDLPPDGREVYPPLLTKIKQASVGKNSGKWALLRTFDKIGSAREAVNRLKKEYPGFQFTSRSDGMGTGATVYARFVGDPIAPASVSVDA